MKLEDIKQNLDIFTTQNQILEAAQWLIKTFGLDDENFAGFGFRDEVSNNSLLLTAEGVLGESQKIMIPKNLFDFDIVLVLNMLAHEMHHVRQKASENIIEDKNEREFQAYYEMLFHELFPQIPELSTFYKKQFGQKALEYYKRMGEESALQHLYTDKKNKLVQLLNSLS